MGDTDDVQAEEREALASIYEGDSAFKQICPTTFQYKYGDDDDYKSFLVEIIWGASYPNAVPEINMDTFFNRNLLPAVKQKIRESLIEEAQQWIGCAMTYTLFECLRDRISEFVADQPENPVLTSVDISSNIGSLSIGEDNPANKKPAKKEHLTKAQKRKQWERSDHKGEKPRGWDWVDIIKHLSQVGSKDNEATQSTVKSLTS